MPYKHIAAHLKKTELACRLHFHQLSHGSNRRKRTTSVSSGSSTSGYSPIAMASIPSPIQEHDDGSSRPCSTSSPSSAGSYRRGSPTNVQLPSIKNGVPRGTSPRLPTILPKPASMTLTLASATIAASPTTSRGYSTPVHESHSQSASLLASALYRGSMTPTTATPHSTTLHNARLPGGLRLDCSALPPPASSTGLPGSIPSPATHDNVDYPVITSHPVDMSRLASIYAAHRAAFWAAIAAEYGNGANPVVLEQAWRGNPSCSTTMGHPSSQMTPITPGGSPDDHVYGKQDKTRISAILGIDANPRSPREREMVKRIEEERVVVVGV